MDDLISRKMAIDALGEEPEVWDDDDEYGMGLRSEWCHIKKTIEKLPSAQPEVAKDTNVLNNDCISRQQAIDALDKHIDTFDAIDTNYLCGLRTAMSILKEMPSAQPETHDKRTETHACDLISRQAAIGALNDEYHGMISDESMKIYQIINWISALPSAQPERKTATWAKTEIGWKCSNCTLCTNIKGKTEYNYCPNCGADMRGESNED